MCQLVNVTISEWEKEKMLVGEAPLRGAELNANKVKCIYPALKGCPFMDKSSKLLFVSL